MKSTDLTPGYLIESYGTNVNPNGWAKIRVTGETIKTCESNPDWFRPVKRFGLRLSDRQWEKVILVCWWLNGICLGYLIFNQR